MTIQEAMHKAVEGGYHINGLDGMATDYAGANSEFSVWTRKPTLSSLSLSKFDKADRPHCQTTGGF
jgi:hypothetical protein